LTSPGQKVPDKETIAVSFWQRENPDYVALRGCGDPQMPHWYAKCDAPLPRLFE
jgi:hypothetical protein